MQIGPKYKIARRLGAPVFEKTQTTKYTLSLARKERTGKKGFTRPKSEYGQALTEKQKARFSYGLSERQFRGYVEKSAKAENPSQKLFTLLETRLDNVLFRSGLAKSRSAGRQMSSHGHALVNGKRVDVPSIALRNGDVVSVRTGSQGSVLFAEVTERMKALSAPAWLSVEAEKREATVTGEPVYAGSGQVFDLSVAIQFYNR